MNRWYEHPGPAIPKGMDIAPPLQVRLLAAIRKAVTR